MEKGLKTMIENMPEKTGKSLQEWRKLLDQKNFNKHGEGVKYLKTSFGVTHGYATTIMTLALDGDTSTEDLVTNQYKGKENLFPIYEKLINTVQSLGPDVKISPKKTSVSIIRKRQFALIRPATKTRIDLGLKIPEKEVSGRLENSGPFGVMCSHRVRISDVQEIDEQLITWVKEAYEKSI